MYLHEQINIILGMDQDSLEWLSIQAQFISSKNIDCTIKLFICSTV